MENINLLEKRRHGHGWPKKSVIVPLYKTMSARELFPVLNQMRLDARPVVGQDRGPYKLDKTGRKRYFGKPTPIFGPSTFRNIINENGEHV